MKLLLALALLAPHASRAEADIVLDVEHTHMIGACSGTLTLSEAGIRFDSTEPEHSRSWTYADVKYFEWTSRQGLVLHTYESHGLLQLRRDRKFLFEVAGGIDNGVHDLLVQSSPRAVVSPPSGSSSEALQTIPVRHRHRLGGCEGELTIESDRIVYRSGREEDSRQWRLQDLETFASSNPFRLRISTAFETFTFDLKIRISDTAYNHIWRAVYSPGIQTYTEFGRSD